jgi:hypothetical protein
MPIDPKKFKKVVTNHFDNLTAEDFLKTLHKSSPYLFDENSVEKQDVQLLDRDKTTSLNTFTKLFSIDEEFRGYLIEEAHRMKSNKVAPVTICIYLIKFYIHYGYGVLIQSIIYSTEKITKILTKKV